jgi:hypothetical protein
MDNLEKFIKQNKNAFDEEPSAELWNKISGQLQAEKQPAKIVRMMPIQRVWQIAAGFAALLVFGLALQWLYFAKQNEGLTAFKTPPPVEQLVPELAEAEKFYAMQISQTQVALKNYEKQDQSLGAALNKEAMTELGNLDKAYAELKKEFYTSGNQEAVISALIQNLQLRLELLNQQLQVIQKTEEVKKGQTSI